LFEPHVWPCRLRLRMTGVRKIADIE
jgi:hypothetical protein